MRYLFPVDNKSTVLHEVESRPVTFEEYNNLVKLVTEFQAEVENYTSQIEAFKSDLATAFTTGTLSSNTASMLEATITALVTESVASQSASITEADIHNLTSVVIRAGQVNTGDVTAELLNVTGQSNFNNLFAEHITAESVTTDKFATGDLEVDNLDADSSTIQHATIQEAIVNEATIDNLDTDEATIQKADITELASDSAVIENGEFGTIEVDFIHHNTEFQTVDDSVTNISGGYWVELPKIVNGWQRIVAVKSSDESDIVFAVENFNSINNMRTHWSINTVSIPITELTKFDVYEGKLYLTCNTKESLKLYYIADDYNSTDVPKIYANDPLLGKEIRTKEVEYLHANYFWQHLETPDMEALKPLNLNSTSDYDNTLGEAPTQYDGTEAVSVTSYKPDQDVNTDADVEFNSVKSTTTFKSPHFWIGDREDWEDEKDDLNDYALVITDEE